MKKKTIKLLKVAILLVSALIAIVVYRGTVSTCKLPASPFPSHTFEVVDSDGEEGGAK